MSGAAQSNTISMQDKRIVASEGGCAAMGSWGQLSLQVASLRSCLFSGSRGYYMNVSFKEFHLFVLWWVSQEALL